MEFGGDFGNRDTVNSVGLACDFVPMGQFPAGNHTRSRAMQEEIGLSPEHVDVLGSTRGWLRYRLPERFIRRHQHPVCVGQKQVWFMLRLIGDEGDVCLDRSEKPEFDHWRWVDYWQPLREVVPFKRSVYKKALNELAPLLFPDGQPRSSAR